MVLGVMAGDVMEHQLGVLEGPCWLEASSAVLDLLPAVEAEARCAEWLLQHAAPLARA